MLSKTDFTACVAAVIGNSGRVSVPHGLLSLHEYACHIGYWFYSLFCKSKLSARHPQFSVTSPNYFGTALPAFTTKKKKRIFSYLGTIPTSVLARLKFALFFLGKWRQMCVAVYRSLTRNRCVQQQEGHRRFNDTSKKSKKSKEEDRRKGGILQPWSTLLWEASANVCAWSVLTSGADTQFDEQHCHGNFRISRDIFGFTNLSELRWLRLTNISRDFGVANCAFHKFVVWTATRMRNCSKYNRKGTAL